MVSPIMKQPTTLGIASLLTTVLFTVHLAQDFIYGLDAMTRAGTTTYLLIVLVLLYGTLELQGRRLGYLVMLLGGILATGLPVLHNVGGPRAAKLGFFFVWTLLALGATGIFSVVLSGRELARSFRKP
jgi:hypothetical protein